MLLVTNRLHFPSFLFRFTAKVLRKMFFVMSRVWDKGKILSLHEESNLRPLDFQCSTTKPQRLYGERGLLQSSHDMHPNTARISNVDSIMFVIRLKEMVTFEFSMETEKDVFFCLVTGMGQKEKILRPHEELNIRPLDS